MKYFNYKTEYQINGDNMDVRVRKLPNQDIYKATFADGSVNFYNSVEEIDEDGLVRI